ncbi:MAG: hypothetical protein Q4C89_00780 [Deinococcus sp.]|uniref:hypothetical protein n=1 Tax=Deinococcus sp. TaxID=47478 RepID=UPI0026DB2119|nr:hypothetical protein [Deinococcus sp.]MDO4244543.1 hypothetical protein [Deinococcus sp.]
MNTAAFAKVIESASQSTSDRLIVGDMPGNQWLEIPVDGCAVVERSMFGVDFQLRFQPADEFKIPFYPEHVYWVSRGGIAAGRLLLRVAVRHQSDDAILVCFRHERNARTQMMRPIEFTIDPDFYEATLIANHTNRQFLIGFDAYSVHLKVMFPDDWERITKARAAAEWEGWL